MLHLISRGAIRTLNVAPRAAISQLPLTYAIRTYRTKSAASELKEQERETRKLDREKAALAKQKALAAEKLKAEKERERQKAKKAAALEKEKEKKEAQKEKEKAKKLAAKLKLKEKAEAEKAKERAKAQKVKDKEAKLAAHQIEVIKKLSSFLLTKPKAPVTGFSQFVLSLSASGKFVNIPKAAEEWAQLSQTEKDEFSAKHAEAEKKYEAEYKAFILSHTPQEIFNHELALKKLKAYEPFRALHNNWKGKMVSKDKMKSLMRDPRLPPAPVTSYFLFHAEATKDTEGIAGARSKELAQTWKEMTPEQKEVYRAKYEDYKKNTYEPEMIRLFGVANPTEVALGGDKELLRLPARHNKAEKEAQ